MVCGTLTLLGVKSVLSHPCSRRGQFSYISPHPSHPFSHGMASWGGAKCADTLWREPHPLHFDPSLPSRSECQWEWHRHVAALYSEGWLLAFGFWVLGVLGSATVHISTLAAMTGASRFSEEVASWRYDVVSSWLLPSVIFSLSMVWLYKFVVVALRALQQLCSVLDHTC